MTEEVLTDVEIKPCAACGAPTPGWVEWRNERRSRVHCCKDCHDNGKFEKWIVESCAIIDGCDTKGMPTGNLQKDRQEVERWLKRDGRIKDGVCPNGCALMFHPNDDEYQAECPQCHFVLNSNVPIKLP